MHSHLAYFLEQPLSSFSQDFLLPIFCLLLTSWQKHKEYKEIVFPCFYHAIKMVTGFSRRSTFPWLRKVVLAGEREKYT